MDLEEEITTLKKQNELLLERLKYVCTKRQKKLYKLS